MDPKLFTKYIFSFYNAIVMGSWIYAVLQKIEFGYMSFCQKTESCGSSILVYIGFWQKPNI